MANILKIKVTDDVEFGYYDSGPPPDKSVYDTIVLIHGHTYHSGAFMPMHDQAHSFGLRVILINRRLYPGSTPYTKEETDALHSEKTDDLNKVLFKQGEYLLLAVNKIIAEHKLQSVLLVAWSLGTAFLNVTVAAITAMTEDVQSNLRKTVKSIVWWDPPATTNGYPNPPTGGWIPLYDTDLSPEERGQAFGLWLSQYFPHKDLEKRDPYNFIYKITTPIKTPSFTGMPFEELLTKIDLTAGVNGDNAISDVHIQPTVGLARERGAFNKEVRTAWGNIPFTVIHGEESPWMVVWGVWKFEEQAKNTGMPMKIVSMPGANHFVFIDNTKLAFETLKACI